MQSQELASSALQRAVIGPLRVSVTYVSHLSHPCNPLLIFSQEFLFYYEKWEPPKNKNDERARLVACIFPDRKRGFNPTVTFQSDGQPPRDWDPFVKQTYSVYLNENENNKRKWHLSAYLSASLFIPVSYF